MGCGVDTMNRLWRQGQKITCSKETPRFILLDTTSTYKNDTSSNCSNLAMLRDGLKSTFYRVSTSDREVKKTVSKAIGKKTTHLKYRNKSFFENQDRVVIGNIKRFIKI